MSGLTLQCRSRGVPTRHAQRQMRRVAGRLGLRGLALAGVRRVEGQLDLAGLHGLAEGQRELRQLILARVACGTGRDGMP